MSKVILVAKMCQNIKYDPNYDYIGIDAGAKLLKDLKIPMVKAIGDFDSIDDNELNSLREYSPIEKLNPIKDDTDSEHALKFACSNYDDVEIYGVIGGRIDHFVAILNLLKYSDLNFKIIDNRNRISKLNVGKHYVDNSYKYFSIYANNKSMISIQNAKYNLKKVEIDNKDIYTTSNEVVNDSAIIEVFEGSVLLIECKD